MKNLEKVFFSIILVAFVFIATAFAYFNKDFRAPDERFHLAYIDLIIRDSQLPKLIDIKDISEAHQPPAYYLALTPIRIFNHFDNSHLAVFTIRMCSIIFGTLTLLVAWKAVRLFIESRVLQVLAIGSIAFLPMFIHISSSINNDALANLVGAIMALLTIRLIKKPFSFNTYLSTALIISLALITKTTLYPFALALFFIAIIKWVKEIQKYKGEKTKSYMITTLIIFLLIVMLIAGWWFARNFSIYGEPFGHKYTKDLWYDIQNRDLFTKPNLLMWGQKTYDSFFGVFGYMNISMNPIIYKILRYIGVFVFAIYVISLFKKSKDKENAKINIVFLITTLITLGLIFQNSINFYQPQGRYLFICLVPIVLIVAMSMQKILPKKFNLAFTIFYLVFMFMVSIHSLMLISS